MSDGDIHSSPETLFRAASNGEKGRTDERLRSPRSSTDAT
ncbi:MAG: hypothetical protein IPJ30_15110 [Acidobacteria bacterium]|nr:hypothetical protein [Acidobacteriota bacterium]